MCFRFLVQRGAQVSYHDALEYQQCHVAHRLEGLERVSVAQVEKLQPVLQLGAEMLAVARHQDRWLVRGVGLPSILRRPAAAAETSHVTPSRWRAVGAGVQPVPDATLGSRRQPNCHTTWEGRR